MEKIVSPSLTYVKGNVKYIFMFTVKTTEFHHVTVPSEQLNDECSNEIKISRKVPCIKQVTVQ